MRWQIATALVLSAATLNGCTCTAPQPVLHVRPSTTVQVGQTVTFDSNRIPSDPEDYTDQGTIFHWDLDGDGKFETNGGRVVQMHYDLPGTYKVTLDEVNGTWEGFGSPVEFIHGYKTVSIQVKQPKGPPNQAPTASFTEDHNPWYTENDIKFDASGSHDPDGTIVKYEWDWEADGTYDQTGVTATHSYPFAGTYTVRLRVTDDSGDTGTTENTVQVNDGVPPGKVIAREASGVSAAKAGVPFELKLSGASVTPGTTTVGGSRLVTAGVRAHGRLRLTRVPRILGRRGSIRWAAILSFVQRGNRLQAKVSGEGYLLLALSRHASVCLAAKAKGKAAGTFDGRLAVAGGTGRGARLRGPGTFGPPVARSGSAVVKGRLKLRRVHKPRGLPKACRKLVRALPG